MTQERIHEIYEDYKKAITKLEEALAEDVSLSPVIVDGVIQRFEFSFELSWKLLQAVVQYQGTDAKSPRTAIKEAYRMGILEEGEDWIEMLEDRNRSSHIYDEKQALKIYGKIKKMYIENLRGLKEELGKRISEL